MVDLISTIQSLPLVYGCKVRWEAIDIETGGPVSGVVIVDPVLYGQRYAIPSSGTTTATPSQTPLWLPVAG